MERFPSGQREQTVNLPAYAFGGSNPPLSTIFDEGPGRAGIAQLVEREPSKLGVAGSNPVSRSSFQRPAGAAVIGIFRPGAAGASMQPATAGVQDGWAAADADYAHVAQSVEHFLGKEEVTGSNPVVGFGV